MVGINWNKANGGKKTNVYASKMSLSQKHLGLKIIVEYDD